MLLEEGAPVEDPAQGCSGCISELSLSGPNASVPRDFLENQVTIQSLELKVKETSNENLRLLHGIEERDQKVENLLNEIKELGIYYFVATDLVLFCEFLLFCGFFLTIFTFSFPSSSPSNTFSWGKYQLYIERQANYHVLSSFGLNNCHPWPILFHLYPLLLLFFSAHFIILK